MNDNLQAIEALSYEQRKFPPASTFVQSANASDMSLYKEAEQDHEGFWARQARELLDWSVPHESYFRPPIKFRCRDGYLGLPQALTPFQSDWDKLEIEVLLNNAVVQRVALSTLKRSIAQLLADVGEFMALQAGDVLMVGTDCLQTGLRPSARAGDTVQIRAAGLESVVQKVTTVSTA